LHHQSTQLEMVAKAFINLPVKNLEKSISFFTHIGFSFDLLVTDENAACMIINGNTLFVILLKEDYFKTFTKKPICDTTAFNEVLITIHIESKESIQTMIEKARMLGAIIHEPEDRGWMYQNCLTDLDGHQWEFIFMDESQIPN
jgi:uncharacterized protein